MSIDEIFTLALWMAVLSIAALVVVGRRKPARATRRSPRGAGPSSAIVLQERPTTLERSPGVLRRLAALFGLGVTAVVVGALAVLVISVTVAVSVITISGLLD